MGPVDPRVERLRQLVQAKAVLHGEFVLSSGQKSAYYFDGRRVTHDAEGIALVGELLSELLEQAGVVAIGGPATGANPLVTATQLASFRRGLPMGAFYVRAERKGHGAGRLIEGNPPPAGASVAIVDDTLTTGASIQRAIDAAEAEGLRVAKVIVLVDRRQGGAERLRACGYDVHALLEADEQGNII